MKSLKSLSTMIACCLLTACASSMPLAPVPPANLTAPCQPPAPLPANADMGALLAADVDLAGQYHECAARHRGLVEWAGGVR